MAKTADEARKAAMTKKLPTRPAGKLTKGGGKGLSGDALVGKVSQKTIDSIKKLGMTEALKLAGKNGKTSGGMAREFQEGVRRMYGAKRLEAAKTKYAPVAKTADAARAGVTKPAPKPATKPTTKPTTKPGTKSNSNFGKAVAGLYGAAAVGAMVTSKGKAAGLAAKLSPAVGAAAKSRVGKAVFGTGETLTNKAFSASGRMAAKAGKPVSQTQYDAMMAAAKAKGIKAPTADAAKKAATKTTKTTKK